MVEILTPPSSHKLLKNLGALSEYDKCSQSSTKQIIFRSLLTILDTMEWSKKPSHATVPLTMKLDENRSTSFKEAKHALCDWSSSRNSMYHFSEIHPPGITGALIFFSSGHHISGIDLFPPAISHIPVPGIVEVDHVLGDHLVLNGSL
jgi:hypothetical protein